jgi:FixJ family two-component response regulator
MRQPVSSRVAAAGEMTMSSIGSGTLFSVGEGTRMSSPPDSTVFVVDDDPDIRTSFRWLIESVGLRVETYESADAFLEAYSPDVPGCLVLDVRMPEMSGLDLLDALRQRAIEIPVTIITAYGDVQKAVRAMKNGAIDFIEKPIGDQTLLDRIHQSLDSDRKRREELAEIREIEARIDLLTLPASSRS